MTESVYSWFVQYLSSETFAGGAPPFARAGFICGGGSQGDGENKGSCKGRSGQACMKGNP